jgi:hypothetical protein
MTCIFKPFCVCVCIYIKKSKLSFFLFLSMESCWVPQLHRRKEEERARRMAGSPLSLSPTFAALSRGAFCHARGISNQSQSQPSAGVLSLSLSLSHPPERGHGNPDRLSAVLRLRPHESCMSRKEGIGRKTAWQAVTLSSSGCGSPRTSSELIRTGSTAGQSCAGHIREEQVPTT